MRIRENNWLAIKLFFSDASSTLALPSFRGVGANVPGFGNVQNNNHRLVVIQDIHSFGSRLSNEARIGYSFLLNATASEEAVKDVDVGIQRVNATQYPGLPLLRIAPAAGGVIIGTVSNTGPAASSVTTLADTLSNARGSQTIPNRS
jgi:hypothetical protein